MKKKFLSVLLALCLLTAIVPMSVSAHPFTDVKNQWYSSAVSYVYVNDIFKGTSPNNFSPERFMTRAQFVTALANNTSNYYEPSTGSKFADVKYNSWYYNQVKWANDNGLVDGTGRTTFSPNAYLNREQLVKILYEYAKRTGSDVTNLDNKYLNFRDYNSVSSWAKTPMRWAITQGIINGSGSYIRPKNYAKRCEVATIFMNSEYIIPPESTLQNSNESGPNTDFLKGLDMTHAQLKVNGFTAEPEDQGFMGSRLYTYNLYPDVYFLTPYAYQGFTDNTKPVAVMTNFGTLFPELAGKSVSSVKSSLGSALSVDEGGPVTGASGYAAAYSDADYTYFILMQSSSVFYASDTTIVSKKSSSNTNEDDPVISSSDFIYPINNTHNNVVAKYGKATKTRQETTYGTVFEYYTFADLPGIEYYYSYAESRPVAVNGISAAGFYANLSVVAPKLAGINFTEGKGYTYIPLTDGFTLYYYWLSSTQRYYVNLTKDGYSYSAVLTEDEEILTGSTKLHIIKEGI